jgi:glutaredoxin
MRKENDKVDVTLLMRASCKMCSDIKDYISDYMSRNRYVNYQIVDLDDNTINFDRRYSSITPALWVNDKMWFAGNFEIERFDNKLNNLLRKKGDYHE